MSKQKHHSLILNSRKKGLGNGSLFFVNDSECCSFLGGVGTHRVRPKTIIRTQMTQIKQIYTDFIDNKYDKGFSNRFNPILSDMFFGSNRQKSVREKIKPTNLLNSKLLNIK